MLDFFNSSLPIAKKEHKCHICGMSISEGEQYSRESGKYDGDFFDRATCKCCYSARDDYFNESGENEYDDWCISDMVRDAVCHKCDRYEECEFADPLWCEDIRKDYIKITEERWNRMENKKMKLYAARDKNTGKLVSGITNPSHKFWQREADCKSAISRYNCDRYKRGNYDLELVTYELVEVKESTNSNYIRSMNDEELAKWLTRITDDAQLDARTKCNYQWSEWLKEVRQ